MKPFSQCFSAWAQHPLGWGGKPGTICQYGCYDTVLSGILSATGHPHNPATLDELLTSKRLFVRDPSGTFDFMPGTVLDLLYPGEYKTQTFSGFRADIVKAALPTPNAFIVYHVAGYSPLWKMTVATHYVHGWTADGVYIGDPEGGVVRKLADYGGPKAVQQTILITYTKRPAPVVIPVVKPGPIAIVPPPPVLYSVVVGKLFIAAARPWDAAVALADDYAKLHVGTMIEIQDAAHKTVGTAFYPALPSPVDSGPISLPTPLPGQADVIGLIQRLLVDALLLVRYLGRHQGNAQKNAA